MCMSLKRFFKVPWHKKDARAYDVLTLVGHPLLTSLFATALSLNVMVFLSMYTKCFHQWYINMSYGSCAAALSSFLFFLLAVVYGQATFVTLGYLLHQAFFVQHFWLSLGILRVSRLDTMIDKIDLTVVRILICAALFLIVLLTMRGGMVTIATIEAMMCGGALWDLDDAKAYKVKSQRRTGISITVQEDV